ncbi:hypothetical protein ACUNWD_06310 [Sunxiuqinia sp. A32]|uniref:hypothetical protein n=1 Tax=Sunxiuqinia sp. A32 TaxID=3461496 RepID=UPI0040455F29
MKARNFLFVFGITLLLSSCIVFSFYPLYTEDDLFANDLLLGEWVDDDSSIWKFDFNYKGKEIPENIDSTAYILRIKEKDDTDFGNSSFIVHLIQLDETYFLDFYLDEYFESDDLTLFDFHVMPVHSFAKLEFINGEAQIHWFDPEWLEDLIKENRIRIHHENNGEQILLTAKPQELQKFATKYVHSEEALDGIDAILKKVNE